MASPKKVAAEPPCLFDKREALTETGLSVKKQIRDAIINAIDPFIGTYPILDLINLTREAIADVRNNGIVQLKASGNRRKRANCAKITFSEGR